MTDTTTTPPGAGGTDRIGGTDEAGRAGRRARTARWAARTSAGAACAVLLASTSAAAPAAGAAGPGPGAAYAADGLPKPAPHPSITVPSGAPSLPGADNPTAVPPPTAAPSLPGEKGGGGPSYSEPPDHLGGSRTPHIDPKAGGLMLADGARLAPPRVLDVKSVTEDMSGEERREDSTRKTKFTLQAEVLFPKDSARLNRSAHSRIRRIAEEIGAQHATEIDVYGFTDDLGSYAHGKKLSRKRADAVQQELAKSGGAEATYHVRGYSEDYPVADNHTEAGRKKNRRVEVSFPRTD